MEYNLSIPLRPSFAITISRQDPAALQFVEDKLVPYNEAVQALFEYVRTVPRTPISEDEIIALALQIKALAHDAVAVIQAQDPVYWSQYLEPFVKEAQEVLDYGADVAGRRDHPAFDLCAIDDLPQSDEVPVDLQPDSHPAADEQGLPSDWPGGMLDPRLRLHPQQEALQSAQPTGLQPAMDPITQPSVVGTKRNRHTADMRDTDAPFALAGPWKHAKRFIDKFGQSNYDFNTGICTLRDALFPTGRTQRPTDRLAVFTKCATAALCFLLHHADDRTRNFRRCYFKACWSLARIMSSDEMTAFAKLILPIHTPRSVVLALKGSRTSFPGLREAIRAANNALDRYNELNWVQYLEQSMPALAPSMPARNSRNLPPGGD